MLSPKDPAEIINVTFDFSALTSAQVSVPVVTSTVAFPPPFGTTTDLSPQSMLNGAAQITGTSKIIQSITGGLAAIHYYLSCKVVAGSETYVLADTLPVVTAPATQ